MSRYHICIYHVNLIKGICKLKGIIYGTVTAIILARNEEKHIVDCIKSIQFADEILVIDDGKYRSDGTPCY